LYFYNILPQHFGTYNANLRKRNDKLVLKKKGSLWYYIGTDVEVGY